MDPRRDLVAAGYDRLAKDYLDWASSVRGDPRERMLADFSARLPDGARVLDLGCGAGLPSTALLARRFAVTGVDISRSQIALARRNVPGAIFRQGDIGRVRFSEAAFDGVTALYSIIHVPRAEHARIFVRIARWLRRGGWLLAVLGGSDGPDWTGEWLGVPMFFSSHDPVVNRELLRAAGFEVHVDEIVEIQEPEGPVAFQWVIARRR
jgi:SAM-dependent methyltransferase